MNEDIKCEVIGQMDNTIDHTFESANRVYSTDGLAPTCNTCGGGGLQTKIIVAMRGRNPENPISRKSGLPTEQRLEINEKGGSNTLTTVQKDNLVLIKQATKKGYIELEEGGLFDGSYPTSSTSRGRVQEGGSISPTITAQNNEIYRAESKYRIRKLTPKECFRLMGVTDEDADKMLAVNSNSQCYKQAGNSIVVDVMAAIFKELI